MKALDLILLIQKTCKSDDEIFIRNLIEDKYDPNIEITSIDWEEYLKDYEGKIVDKKKAFSYMVNYSNRSWYLF